MLQRVHTFGLTRREAFPVESLGGEAFRTVGVAVAELARHAASKATTVNEGLRAKRDARAILIDQLKAVARCARAIEVTSPGFADPFRMPSPRIDQALVTTGRVFVAEAGRSAERFAAFGMPADAVARLSAAVDTFEAAIRGREKGKDGVTEARASIASALAAASTAVRQLDVIVANTLRDDPAALAVWARDRHVEGVRRARRSVGVAPTEPSTGSAPAPDSTATSEREVA
jgi:hypothetical protein